MADQIMSRAEAKAQGLKRYFTGEPCKFGHIAERYVRKNNCAACNIEKQRRTYWTRDDLITHLAKLYDKPNVISRSDALAQGRDRYFTGKPCPSGHVCERYTKGWKCVECVKLLVARIGKSWENNNPEKVKAKRAKYLAKNRPLILERKRIANKKNKDKRNEYSKLWREAHPGYDHSRKWKSRPPEWRKEKLREYREADKTRDPKAYSLKTVAHASKRRAQKKSAAERLSREDLAEILTSQKHRCIYCRADLRKTKKHLDHIVPLSRGGTHVKANLQWLCATCNLRKHDKDPIEFAQEQGRLL